VSCDAKRAYGTKKAARRALRRSQSIQAGSGPRSCYRCPGCERWHLTGEVRPRDASAERPQSSSVLADAYGTLRRCGMSHATAIDALIVAFGLDRQTVRAALTRAGVEVVR
jgi:hypothetical protein